VITEFHGSILLATKTWNIALPPEIGLTRSNSNSILVQILTWLQQ